MDCSFLGAGRATIDTHVFGVCLSLGTLAAPAVVGVDQPPGPPRANLPLLVGVVTPVLPGHGRVRLGLFLRQFQIQRLALAHLGGGIAEAFSHRPMLGCGVPLVEDVGHAPIYQSVVSLELVQLLRLVRHVVELGIHDLILPLTRKSVTHQGRFVARTMRTVNAAPVRTPVPANPRLFDLVIAVFCAVLLISNIAATKVVQLGGSWAPGGVPVLPLITDGGAVVFPFTYILSDVMAEVYGIRRARRAIRLGFVLGLLASLTFLLVDAAPPAADYRHGEAFHAVLGFVPRIVAASLAGYLVGQLLNAHVVVGIKQRSRPGSLWWRLLSSTVVGELADTAIFCLIAFGGVLSAPAMVNYILVGYLYKVLVEVVMLPITVRVIAAVKVGEGLPRSAITTEAATLKQT